MLRVRADGSPPVLVSIAQNQVVELGSGVSVNVFVIAARSKCDLGAGNGQRDDLIVSCVRTPDVPLPLQLVDSETDNRHPLSSTGAHGELPCAQSRPLR